MNALKQRVSGCLGAMFKKLVSLYNHFTSAATGSVLAGERQAVRDRFIKSGQASTKVGQVLPLVYEREFVLSSGDRENATSGCVPFFSVFSLPDHFELVWPMHEMLPKELAPLKLPFNIKSTVGKLKGMLIYLSGFHEGDEFYAKSLEKLLKKFVKIIPLLRDLVKLGQPEATATWKSGCRNMRMLFYYRWHRQLLTQGPFALVPFASRSYEEHGFQSTSGSQEPEYDRYGREEDEIGYSSQAEETEMPNGAAFFILRMPESPFPREMIHVHEYARDAFANL